MPLRHASASALAAIALALFAGAARADCGSPPPADLNNLGPYQRWCESCGGTFSADRGVSCTGANQGGSGSGSALPWGSDPGRAMGMAIAEQAVSTFATEFGKWLMTNEGEEGRKREEAERLAALVRQRMADLEQDCRKRENQARFDTEKADLAGQLKMEGGDSVELGFKDLTAGPQGRRAHAESEAERSQRLARLKGDPARIDWCRKNLPACPSRPAGEADAERYEGQLASYARQMSVWEAACERLGAAPGAAVAAKPAAELSSQLKDLSAPTRGLAAPSRTASRCGDSFEDYESREEEHRQVLARLDQGHRAGQVAKDLFDWCKLHRPLCPLEESATVHGGNARALLASYDRRKTEWNATCNVTLREAAAAPRPPRTAPPGVPPVNQPPSSPPPVVPTPNPKEGRIHASPDCDAACFAEWQRQSRHCDSLPTISERLRCGNAANDAKIACRCDSEGVIIR